MRRLAALACAASAAGGVALEDASTVVLSHPVASYPFQGMTRAEVLARYTPVFVTQPLRRAAGGSSADGDDAEEALHQCWVPLAAGGTRDQADDNGSGDEDAAAAADPAAAELRGRLNKCRAALAPAGLLGGRPPPALPSHANKSPASCVVRQLPGYWAYEVCPSLAARQFHVRTDSRSSSSSSSSTGGGAPTPEHSLGRHDPSLDEVAVDEDGALVYMQTFTRGDGGRSAVVTYRCDAGGDTVLAPGVSSGIVSINEDPPLHYSVAVAVRDAALCEALPSPASIVAPVNETCFSLADGWWSYSVCLGKSITQFHVGSSGEQEATTVIGTYAASAGEALEAASLDLPAAVVQEYGDGTPCDAASGKPRRARVRFVCAPRPPGSGASGEVTYTLQGVREPSTCSYEFTITSSAACRHPELPPPPGRSRAPPGPSSFIHCSPWDPANPVPAGKEDVEVEEEEAGAEGDAAGAADSEQERPKVAEPEAPLSVAVEPDAEVRVVLEGSSTEDASITVLTMRGLGDDSVSEEEGRGSSSSMEQPRQIVVPPDAETTDGSPDAGASEDHHHQQQPQLFERPAEAAPAAM